MAEYIFDGTADEVEINQAIDDLPASGGSVFLLEGTYNLAASVTLDVANTSLKGVGWGSILERSSPPTTLH